MGMHLTTAINHKRRALLKLGELYSQLEVSGMPSDQVSSRYLEVVKTLVRAGCPQWVLSYVEGWHEANRKVLETGLVFFYTMPDGRLVSTHRDRDDYYEKLGLGPREVYEAATHSGHYWVKARNVNGAPVEVKVPYFVSKMEKR